MGIKEKFKSFFSGSQEPRQENKFSVYAKGDFEYISEALKGEIEKPLLNRVLNKDIEDHPFDFAMLLDLYKKHGFVMGVVDKFTDFIVGPGFYVKSDDPRAQKIIEEFLRRFNFDTLLRAWIKEGLLAGNSFLEIAYQKGAITDMKVLNPNTIYVMRDKFGVVLGYKQILSKLENGKDFKKEEIAHLIFNKVGDSAYGFGIIYPVLNILNNLTQSEKDMHLILSRKANNPFHVKLGDASKDIVPSDADIDAFGQKLTWLNNKHEWVTNPYVEIKAVDFGSVGEKFDFPIKYDLEMLFYSLQVPQVLMGAGSIPEGLAQVQMEAFQRRIQSIQAETEKIIESEIFRRILDAQGFPNVHVEFEWGQPSDAEKREEIDRITKLLALMQLDPKLRKSLEEKLALLLNLEVILETPEEERKREQEEPQPRIPGQNNPNRTTSFQKKKLTASAVTDVDYPLREWVGFNYLDYLASILRSVEKDKFDDLKALNDEELGRGYLTEGQVKSLKETLSDAFTEGWSINEIAGTIKEDVGVKDLLNEAGETMMDSGSRSVMIARTETVRLSNKGALDFMKESGIERVEWIATQSERTCSECATMDGTIFKLNEAYGRIPLHAMCRCTFASIVPGLD